MSSDAECRYYTAWTTRGARTIKVRYEGYGPGGAAVLIECATEDCEQTAGELRGLFACHGGFLGAEGSVAYLFNTVGLLTYAPASQLDRRALEAGAEDVQLREDALVEVITDPDDFSAVRSVLSRAGYAAVAAVITQRAATIVELSGEKAQEMRGLLLELAQNSSVQDIYTNARLAE
jgi:transcriptional/translational regulatory protein YebC/TACO1